jgi:hypothetical protein
MLQHMCALNAIPALHISVMPVPIWAAMFHSTSFGRRVQLFGLVLPDGSRYSQSNRQDKN